MPAATKYHTPLKPHEHIHITDLVLIPDRDGTSNHGTSNSLGARTAHNEQNTVTPTKP